MNRINILLIFLVFCFTSNLTYAQYLKDIKLKDTHSIYKDTISVKQYASEKSPLLAGVLSFIVPGIGIGQMYNKQPGKSFVHTFITAVCFVGITLGILNLNIDMGGKRGGSDAGQIVFLISAGVFVGNWTWSVIDAVISANKINERAMLKKSRSDIMNKIKFGFTVNKYKQHNLKFAFEF